MKIPVTMLCFLVSFNLFARDQVFKNQELSLSVGSEAYEIDKFAPNENLDFINYIDADQDFAEISLLKLGYRFDYLSSISTDFNLIIKSDLIPDSYDFSVHYFSNPWLGLGVGSMLTKNWISYFEEYQLLQLPDYYLVDNNVKQFTTYELGFYLSPMLKPIDNDKLKLQIVCNLGMSFFMKEEATFYHKKKQSNERLQYHYTTKNDFQPFIQPKIDVRVKACKVKEISYGFLLNTSYYYSNRSLNYTRTIQTWTSENTLTEQIKSPKHSYSRFECNVGLFLRW